MNQVESLPPVIRILLDEKLPKSPNPVEVKRYFRRLVPELHRQAKWTLEHLQYVDDHEANPLATDFSVTASGVLNPLTGRSCDNPKCRISRAEHFARTIGLYADIVTIPDAITGHLFRSRSLQDAEMFELITSVAILRVLEPLIRAGVVRFRSPRLKFCGHCGRKLKRQLKKVSAELLPKLQDELTFEYEKGILKVRTGRLDDPPILTNIYVSRVMQRRLESGRSVTVDRLGREYFADELQSILRGVLVEMYSAARTKSSLFSGSRLDLLALHALEHTFTDLKNIDVWEKERSVELPWVKELSAQQIVTLREEAADALPRLREKMVRLMTPGLQTNLAETIAELRDEALEVEAEIKAVKPRRGANFRNVAGVLGVSMAIYGFAADSVPLALGSLMSLLGLLHTSARKDEQDLARQKARPGYVLLKAREMTQHADQHKNN
jgi:hypothetical protein